MEERKSMNHASGLSSERKDSGVNAGAMEKLDLYLELSKGCMEAVQEKSSPKFNIEQCGYLADKLKVVVQSASTFLELSHSNHQGPHLSGDVAKWVEIFKLLLALAKQIEGFVRGCCKEAWVEAAMTLANVADYISSLGFNLELCRVLFSEGECAVMQSGLTLVEVDDINKAEVEAVKQKASVDMDSLLKKATSELHTSELARYLLQRLVRVQPNPTSVESNVLGRLFDWVLSGWEQQLGRGSTATVYKVTWLGTPVAKKTFFGPENPHFMKEVEILSQLCHPNITSMFCSTMNKRESSIIMELMDGDLFTLIQRRCRENSDSPPFSISEAVDIMLQVGEGVNYLHTKRIVHRDLKSLNILVKNVKASELDNGYVQAKVMDFGLSKTKERSTTYSNMTYNEGTFRWMAPELIKPTMSSHEDLEKSEGLPKYKFKCDTYSFAMVCYEILTGDLPFKDEGMTRTVRKMVLKGERPRLPDGCPPLLKALIEKCWNDKPEERPTFALICSALRYLKYLLMREELIQDGAEPKFNQTQLLESEFLAEIDNMMASTLEVGGSSEPEDLLELAFEIDMDMEPIDDTDTDTDLFDTDTAGPSGNGTGWASFLMKPTFVGWFPNRRQDFYTYEAFTEAASAFPAFGTMGSEDDQKREIAAFFGNVKHQSVGLQYVEEIGGAMLQYCDNLHSMYMCADGKRYFGRGPLQMTWNYNYGECGQDLGLDLLANPDQVSQDGVTAFKTALWFWMKRNCHGAIIGPPPSFAQTIRIINGGLECGHGTDERVESRVNAYTGFCQSLGVDPGTDLRC